MSVELQRIHDFVAFLLGVAISVSAVVLTVATFPPGSGPNRGGLSAAPALIVVATVLGGTITGVALSRQTSSGRPWLRTIVLGLTCIGGVMTAIVVYGRYAAPRFFDASFVAVAYRTVLGSGAVLLVATELTSIIIRKSRTG